MPEAPPSVDIIVLSWDRVDDTIATIESALDQVGVETKVFVVDQGTREQDLARLRAACAALPQVTLVCNATNNGVPGGRNQASALGQGEFIVAIDNDAVFADRDQVANAVRIARADPSVAVLGFRILCYENGRDDESSWGYPGSVTALAAQRFETCRFVGAGHLIRRSAFERVGGYDARLFFMHEEMDLSYRFINAGYRLVYEPEIRVLHKVSPERRVAWNDGRYYRHIRNCFYIFAKYRVSPFSGVMPSLSLLIRGFREGYAGATLRGAGSALLLLPAALRFRWGNPLGRFAPRQRERLWQLSGRLKLRDRFPLRALRLRSSQL